jgi:tetratricopeptide (TPR) repeat protein
MIMAQVSNSWTSGDDIPAIALEWYAKGQRYVTTQHYRDALAAFSRAIHVVPDWAEAWYHLGWVWGVLEAYELALYAFDKTLERLPTHAKAWYYRGLALTYLSLPHQGMESVDRALALNPALDGAQSLRQQLRDRLDERP